MERGSDIWRMGHFKQGVGAFRPFAGHFYRYLGAAKVDLRSFAILQSTSASIASHMPCCSAAAIFLGATRSCTSGNNSAFLAFLGGGLALFFWQLCTLHFL